MRLFNKPVITWLLIGMLFFLSGCVGQDPFARDSTLAKKMGLNGENLQAGRFTLAAWQRIAPPVTLLRVYIEGDGFAWKSRSRPSDDPTPHNPVGLMLAMADPSDNVLYLARPCQFAGVPLPTACTPAWWTDKRFSALVIESMNNALSQVVQRYPGAKIELVGYSGGGNIAALLAAQRTDVQSLRTVAGNLDVAYINTLHRVSAMPDAVNAINIAPKLAAMPQIHFSGGADDTVPPAVAKRFQRAAGTRCVQVETVPGMAHGSDWAAIWPRLLRKKIGCGPERKIPVQNVQGSVGSN
ncbi:alpha/beta hydrolase family protein [Cedecea colo]|uniref:Alpha/beta hydrolase n=1 Tax=Cedecea colo TaxID=2552946 RepID=A0ABX0VRV9_9ENTR|nr:alpha/beta hydrolase [Cedecea colo]NIY49334.1 alpha/beta hydrolase [Cedecea colo]